MFDSDNGRSAPVATEAVVLRDRREGREFPALPGSSLGPVTRHLPLCSYSGFGFPVNASSTTRKMRDGEDGPVHRMRDPALSWTDRHERPRLASR